MCRQVSYCECGEVVLQELGLAVLKDRVLTEVHLGVAQAIVLPARDGR